MSSSEPSIVSIFADALTYESPDERSAFLDRACGPNTPLREEVERLLQAHDNAQGFLDTTDAPAQFTDSQLGTLIGGRYKLLESIGEGGMGTVWVAEQLEPVRRKVAIKLVKPGMDSRQVLSRFEAERQALALMDHPNIAKVFDGGVNDQGRPYFVMEYVKGIPFTKYCDDARLPLADRLKLFVQVCQAVQHAHQKGIIHRDLKPSNILVCLYDGQPVPKVIDFGLAKAMHQPLTEQTLHTAHGFMVGTPLYMSPEQAEFNNLDVDTRTDIYALGVILYELLTGSTPLEQQQFKQAALDEMLRMIKEVEPPKPSTRLSGSASLPSIAAQRGLDPAQLSRQVRGDLDWIVMKSLEKERSRRYETANGLARDVERFLNDEPVEACPPSAVYRFKKLFRKHRIAAFAASAVLVTLVLGIGGTSFGLYRARQALARAEQSEIAARAAASAEEKQRKLAEESAEKASKLAISENKAKLTAENSLAALQAIVDFVEQRIFAAAQPTGLQGGIGREITLREAIISSLPYIADSFPGQPGIEARLRAMVGSSFFYLQDFDEATKQLQTALALVEGKADAEDLQALILSELAFCQSAQGNHQAAAAHFQRLFELSLKQFGPQHPMTLAIKLNVADNYRHSGRLNEALTLASEALEQLEASVGPDAAETQNCRASLAQIYYDQRRVDDALQLYQQIIESRSKTLGLDHPDTSQARWDWANTVLNAHLAGVQFRLPVTPSEAMQVLEETLNKQLAALGQHNFYTNEKRLSLAVWYGEFSRYEDAARLLGELVASEVELFGPEAVTTLTSKYYLAQANTDLGRYEDALRLLDEIVPLMIAKIGSTREPTLSARQLKVDVLRDLGQVNQSDDAARELLSTWLKADDGATDVDSLSTRGHVLAWAGDWQGAFSCFQQALATAPEREGLWYMLAYLYAIRGDREGYRKHCELLLTCFGNTQVPTLAERISKPCMLMPDSGLDLRPAIALAQIAATGTDDHPYHRFFMSTNALAHYRSGEYQQAYENAQACIAGEGKEEMNPITGWLISSMALSKMGRYDEAQKAMKNAGKEFVRAHRPTWKSPVKGKQWHDSIYIQILRTECAAALREAAQNAAAPAVNK